MFGQSKKSLGYWIKWSGLLTFILWPFIVIIVLAQAPTQPDNSKTKDATQKTKAEKHGSKSDPLFIHILETPESKEKARQDQSERDAKRKSDDDLAIFTGQLARYTSEVADYTRYLFYIGCIQVGIFVGQLVFVWRQEWWTRKHERAYLFCRPGKPALSGITAGGNYTSIKLRVEVTNFGRTPGFLSEVHWGYSLEQELNPAQTLPFQHKVSQVTVVRPQEGLPTKARLEYKTAWGKTHVVYGRIIYEDIFKRSHSSGFLWKISIVGHTLEHLAVEGFPKYMEWD